MPRQFVQITTLVENCVHTRQLQAELGLSFFIEIGGHAVLFDTGQSHLLVENARRLNVDLTRLEAIVLSHGHYDHTTGLDAVLKLAPQARVFLHPAALGPKFVREPDGQFRNVGMPPASQNAIPTPAQVIHTREKTEIVPGLFVTGEVPRVVPFETAEESFFQDASTAHPDPVPDDQSLYFSSREGTVVLFGCAHSGVVNTIKHIANQTSGRPFYALVGGMHLLKGDRERISRTLEAFREFGFKKLAPAHCTGLLATAMIWNAFPGQCLSCATGSRFEFPL
jgi:7,8-dihydropterin-6-yl-methyl-4-(beta-D-ribofuranosyl)aminobenzene 5'-phosphate synthase